jgi:hypothetical protein
MKRRARRAKALFFFRMRKALPILLLITSTALAEQHGTAYEAMRTVGNQLGRGALSHIVSVSGTAGNPQPARWHIVLEQPRSEGGYRAIDVANGQIVSDKPVSEAPGSRAIETRKLNLDSSGAYAVAAHTADTSHVLFDYVNYTLRSDPRGNPIWAVTLQTAAGGHGGTVHIGANKGTITRVEGMFRGTNTAEVQAQQQAAPPRSEVRGREREEEVTDEETADAEDENFVKRHIKKMFYRARDDAQRMFERVQQSFDDFVHR